MKTVPPVFLRASRARVLLGVLLSVCAFATSSLSSTALAALTEGKEYRRISSQKTDVPEGKIEVIEFFSYLCGSCAQFNPRLNAWKKRLPEDVVFRKIPVHLGRSQWVTTMFVFHTLEALGEEERLSADVFKALHEERINLTDKEVFFDWAEKKGLDRKKVEETFHSSDIKNKVKQSERKANSYKVPSVPHFYVNGRYEVNSAATGNAMLRSIDGVIAIAREDIKKK